MLNSKFIKYGAVNLEDSTAIHLNGDFDSVLSLLQGQVTSDCTLIVEQLGQISSLCNEKGFILCNFEVIFDQNKWLIIIENGLKDIFLKEITKFLPFYKVSLSIDKNNKSQDNLDILSTENWAINRKIMGDHQIELEETGKYRPHELGQHNTRVSFTKGCFKGQEIIARMEYLGKLKKETRLIVHSNQKEVSEFIIIGKSYKIQETIFSSCFGKIDSFSNKINQASNKFH